MSELTEEAYKTRFWGPFSALRKVLAEEKIPDHYYGPTSVSDNMFEAMSRLLQLMTLVREHEADLVKAATADTELGRSLLTDLEHMRAVLYDASRQFSDEGKRVERLRGDIHREVSRADDRGTSSHGA